MLGSVLLWGQFNVINPFATLHTELINTLFVCNSMLILKRFLYKFGNSKWKVKSLIFVEIIMITRWSHHSLVPSHRYIDSLHLPPLARPSVEPLSHQAARHARLIIFHWSRVISLMGLQDSTTGNAVVGMKGGHGIGKIFTDLCTNVMLRLTWPSRCLKSSATWMFVQQCVQANNKEDMKCPHDWNSVMSVTLG